MKLARAAVCAAAVLALPLAARAATPKGGSARAKKPKSSVTAPPAVDPTPSPPSPPPDEPKPSAPSAAKPEPPPPVAEATPTVPAPSAGTEDTFGHGRQFNARVEFATGYSMLFRYDKSPRCAPYNYTKSNTDQQKFCGFGAPPALGIALGFALVDSFEPFAFVRLGLSNQADQTNQGKVVQVGIGARLYTMSDSRFKIFVTPSLGLDVTNGPVEPTTSAAQPGKDDASANVPATAYRTDILAHLDIGPQYDISKVVGVYVSGGLTFQMLRYLGATADLAIGLQMRAP